MKNCSDPLFAKLAQNPFGSDNRWIDDYVNNVGTGESFWKLVAAGKPPECAEIIARFGKFVQPQPNGCWHFTGSLTGRDGWQYGQFALYHGLHIYAHRFAYLIFNGAIPDGLLVRHTCDVTYCVQPSHLLAGTQKDNLQDAVVRCRLPKYRAPRKLTSEQVIAIRRERMRGRTLASLAAEFCVSIPWVSLICRFEGRKHLPSASVPAEKRRAS